MKNLTLKTQRFVYFPASWQFDLACAYEATRQCETLGQCAGLLPRLIADAYLMGGEL